MAVIFAGKNDVENRGRVVVLHRPGVANLEVVQLPNWGGFNGFKAILTNVEISEQGNFQFLHTLGNEIFLYVFGDKIGSFHVNGLAFYDNCQDGQNDHGITRVLGYYRQNRVANRVSPLLITLPPAVVLRCYMVSFRGNVVDAARRMFQFSLGLAMVPEN